MPVGSRQNDRAQGRQLASCIAGRLQFDVRTLLALKNLQKQLRGNITGSSQVIHVNRLTTGEVYSKLTEQTFTVSGGTSRRLPRALAARA